LKDLACLLLALYRMSNDNQKKDKRKIKLAKRTVRAMGERALEEAHGGRQVGTNVCTNQCTVRLTYTFNNHNQALLRRRSGH
jgi:hypothetical protein